MVNSSHPLSREVGIELDDDDENTLFALANLFNEFSYTGSPNITETFNAEGDKHDNDYVILKRSSDQRNTPVFHK